MNLLCQSSKLWQSFLKFQPVLEAVRIANLRHHSCHHPRYHSCYHPMLYFTVLHQSMIWKWNGTTPSFRRAGTPPLRGGEWVFLLFWGGEKKDCCAFFPVVSNSGHQPCTIRGSEIKSIVFVHRDVLDVSGLVNDYGF